MGPARNQRGQASIMIGMMMMTFILFFAFVVNTGMLVNAKINLQNAADLAAYAGAAVQARQLNQISYLNYEMRRQYKKFLFRYYVMGNMAQKPFPRNGGGSGAAIWSPDGGGANYGAPVVCIVFNAKDNFCQIPSLRAISIPPATPLDAINTTLIEQLKAIESIRQQNCLNIAFTNTTVLRLWLWNTDPNLENLQSSVNQPKLEQSINTIRGLAYGLGLIPRELILRQRIQTINDYVNQPAAKAVTFEKAEKMKGSGSPDPAATERTTQAFLSAYYTLGNHTFDAGDIVMDELTPPNLLQLQNIKAKFDAYAVNFEIVPGTGDCRAIVESDTVRDAFPLGVYKSPSTMTYYAIKLKGRAKVMFSPFGDMELKAYAAAQPFGSRIGPKLEEKDFVRREVTLGLQPPTGSTDFKFAKQIPNLPIRETDSTGTGGGWDTQDALSAFYQKFSESDSATGALTSIDQNAMNRAYLAAMVPNPYEANKYNIINDVGSDPFVRNFDSLQTASFWAPIFSPGKPGDAKAQIEGMLEGLIGEAGANSAEFKQGIQKELSNYIAKLRKGEGEVIGGHREGFNIVSLEDPISTREGTHQAITLSGGLAMTDPAQFKSSWNGVLNSEFKKQGRVGYSVKFVSFDSLRTSKGKTDGAETWTNTLAPDDTEADSDLPLIRH